MPNSFALKRSHSEGDLPSGVLKIKKPKIELVPESVFNPEIFEISKVDYCPIFYENENCCDIYNVLFSDFWKLLFKKCQVGNFDELCQKLNPVEKKDYLEIRQIFEKCCEDFIFPLRWFCDPQLQLTANNKLEGVSLKNKCWRDNQQYFKSFLLAISSKLQQVFYESGIYFFDDNTQFIGNLLIDIKINLALINRGILYKTKYLEDLQDALLSVLEIEDPEQLQESEEEYNPPTPNLTFGSTEGIMSKKVLQSDEINSNSSNIAHAERPVVSLQNISADQLNNFPRTSFRFSDPINAFNTDRNSRGLQNSIVGHFAGRGIGGLDLCGNN